MPQIISVLEPSGDHCGAILMEYLEGELLKNDDWSPDLAFEIGVALAHLHNNRTEAYGDVSKPQALIQNPNLYFNEKFEEELGECKGHLPENVIENCASYLKACQSLLAGVDGPCLVHRDFRPGNMIVRHGKLQGILDWSSARSGARCKNWSVRGKTVCHFHGGKSTGPKTTIGREKIRAANYRHGMRSKESIQHLKEIRRLIKKSKSFLEKM